MINFNKSHYAYTALFCEENIYHLCQSLLAQGIARKHCEVIFISNQHRSIALFSQQLSNKTEAIIWDYHVVLQAEVQNKRFIFDFDSQLDFPCKADIYWTKTLPNKAIIKPQYLSNFRIIHSADYCRYFHSDRLHMQGMIESNQYPKENCILTAENKNRIRLDEYWNMNLQLLDNSFVLSFDEFIARVDAQSSDYNHTSE